VPVRPYLAGLHVIQYNEVFRSSRDIELILYFLVKLFRETISVSPLVQGFDIDLNIVCHHRVLCAILGLETCCRNLVLAGFF